MATLAASKSRSHPAARAFVLLLGLATVPAVAQPYDENSAVSNESPLKENLVPEGVISGAILAGVVFEGSPSAQRPRLGASIPARWRGAPICVRLVSSDGRYVAEKGYRIVDNWKGGPTNLPFASQYAHDLAGFAPGEMAVAVRKGDCETATELSIAFWNSDAAAGDARILVNSFGADEAYIFVGDDPADLGCQPVKRHDHLAYDFSCSVPAAALKGEGDVAIEINRVRAGNFDEPEVVVIARTGG